MGDLKGASRVNEGASWRAFGVTAAKVKAFRLPSLKEVEIVVAAPEPSTPAEVVEALTCGLAREHAPKRERAAGERVEPGDELIADVLAYANGKLVPQLAQENLRYILGDPQTQPWFGEQLAQVAVGSTANVRSQLPQDFAVAALRGTPVVLAVHLKRAIKVEPFKLEDPAFLARLGKGKSLDEVLVKVSQELNEGRVAGLRLRAGAIAVSTLVQRLPIEIPAALIDQEVGRLWKAREGDFLSRVGVSKEEREALLLAWLDDPKLREDARKQLVGGAILQTIAKDEALLPTDDEARAFVIDGAKEMGSTAERGVLADELKEAGSGALRAAALHLATLRAMDWMLGQIKVRVEGISS